MDEKNYLTEKRPKAKSLSRLSGNTLFMEIMKQEYRHTKPIRGKDPTFEKEGLDWTKESLVDNLIEYIYHECGKGNWPTREGVDKIVSKKENDITSG